MILEHWDEEAKESVRNFSQKEKDRLNAIIAMHILVCNMNDEDAYLRWVTAAVPDCPTEWDFISFAQNDEGTEENKSFNYAVGKFKNLWEMYAKEDHGLYIGGKAY